MSQTSNLKIGHPLEVTVKDGPWAGFYLSRVEEYRGDYLVLAALLRDRNVVPLPKGQELHITYTDGSKVYIFDASVLVVTGGDVPQLILGEIKNFQETQRRNFVRLNVALPLKLTILDDNFEAAGPAVSAQTLDISGGGLKVKTLLALTGEETIEVDLSLPNYRIHAIAKAVRVEEYVHNNTREYLVGLEYTIVEGAERDKIIAFIFQKQRELRLKRFI